MKLGLGNFSQSDSFLSPKVTVSTSDSLGSSKIGKRFNGPDYQKRSRGNGVKLSCLDIPDYFVTIV